MLEGVRSPHRYGQWTRFTYDALGRRLTKLGDVTFRYLWNGNVPLHEWRTGERYEDGGLKSYSEDLKTWLFEEESFVPLALIQEGKAYSIVCDQLGTPTEAYDEEGREVWYRRLDMNGKILEEAQPGLNPEGYVSIPFLFQGQYYDYETGLAYNRFRYYDPELGRYISEDPIGFLSGTICLYNFVENPNIWYDPFGLFPLFTPKTKGLIIKENFEHFDGVIRCEKCKQSLVKARKSLKGVTPPQNEIQIDHIVPQSHGGRMIPVMVRCCVEGVIGRNPIITI